MTENWRPNPGPQTRFLSLSCYEALYGGAAGGGKSESLVIDAIRYVGRGYGPNYQALLLRRTFEDLRKSLLLRADKYYPMLGGKYDSQAKCWKFPGGERVWFGYLEHERDVEQYQSAEFQFVGFDELTHFSEAQYVYLFSRLRTACNVPLRMRAGTNPGGPGHDWVFRRWGYWLDPESKAKAAPGSVLHIETRDGVEIISTRDNPLARGRCFVPALVDDNPRVDAGYKQNLEQLDAVKRAQLKLGNWLVKPAAGLYFKRDWFEIVGAAPSDCKWVRFWDRAATEGGGDWTVGVLMGRAPDRAIYIADVVRLQGSPGRVKATIQQTAEIDGRGVIVGLSEDPGQAGKFEAEDYAKALQGFTVRFLRETGDKITRAGPLSSQAERRLVKLVRGAWNLAYLSELEGFPDGSHDDDVDGSSGAFAIVAGGPTYGPSIAIEIIDREQPFASGF